VNAENSNVAQQITANDNSICWPACYQPN